MKDSFGQDIHELAIVVRATEVTGFLGCRRKWWFESHNGMNLEPRALNNKLRFGKAWHTALEYLYSGADPLQGFTEQHEKDKKEIPEEVLMEEETQKELQENEKLAHDLLPLYAEWACKEALPSDQDLEPIATEQRLLIPIGDGSIPYREYLAVKVDAVFRMKNSKLLFAMEHKTMGKSSSVGNPDNLPLDMQMGLQLWALREFVRYQGMEHTVAGDIFNLMRKQLPSNRVKAPIFGRHDVQRSNLELDLLHHQLIGIVGEMKRAIAVPATRFHNPQPWGGMCAWGCAFRDACISMQRGEDYEWILNAMFKPREKDIWETLQQEMEG